ARHGIGHLLLEGSYQIVDVLGVEARRKQRRADDVANHDRQLALLEASGAEFSGGRWLIAGRLAARLPSARMERRARWPLTANRGAGAAKVGNERLGDRIGFGVQLALERDREVLIVLEGFGLASGGSQGADDKSMRILAQGIHRDGAAGRF